MEGHIPEMHLYRFSKLLSGVIQRVPNVQGGRERGEGRREREGGGKEGERKGYT